VLPTVMLMDPTTRFLRRGEALPGQFVEAIGDTSEASLWPRDPARSFYAGHPGVVDKDWEDGRGGHLVVIWWGLEDSDDSNEISGYGFDKSDVYPGLGWIDQATYTERADRLSRGQPPLDTP
jgi:hypothetical protein